MRDWTACRASSGRSSRRSCGACANRRSSKATAGRSPRSRGRQRGRSRQLQSLHPRPSPPRSPRALRGRQGGRQDGQRGGDRGGLRPAELDAPARRGQRGAGNSLGCFEAEEVVTLEPFHLLRADMSRWNVCALICCLFASGALLGGAGCSSQFEELESTPAQFRGLWIGGYDDPPEDIVVRERSILASRDGYSRLCVAERILSSHPDQYGRRRKLVVVCDKASSARFKLAGVYTSDSYRTEYRIVFDDEYEQVDMSRMEWAQDYAGEDGYERDGIDATYYRP